MRTCVECGAPMRGYAINQYGHRWAVCAEHFRAVLRANAGPAARIIMDAQDARREAGKT